MNSSTGHRHAVRATATILLVALASLGVATAGGDARGSVKQPRHTPLSYISVHGTELTIDFDNPPSSGELRRIATEKTIDALGQTLSQREVSDSEAREMVVDFQRLLSRVVDAYVAFQARLDEVAGDEPAEVQELAGENIGRSIYGMDPRYLLRWAESPDQVVDRWVRVAKRQIELRRVLLED